MHLKILLVLLLVGGVVHQYPETLEIVAEHTPLGDGTACGATENYFTALGEDRISDANKYKFAGDRFPSWVDSLGTIDSIECTCDEDISDSFIKNNVDLPDSLTNVTDARLVLYTIEGELDGEPSTMKGGAVVFQLLTPGWFVSQEGYYEVDGEPAGSMNIGQLTTQCTP